MSQSCCAPPTKRANLFLLIAIGMGILSGLLNIPFLMELAGVVSKIFINFLKLVSLPIIFLSIVSTASGMDSVEEIKSLGKRVLCYTLFTTLLAGVVAFGLFVAIDPVRSVIKDVAAQENTLGVQYVDYLLKMIPSNLVQPFSENQVIGVLFLALILSLAILSIPQENRKTLHNVFNSLYRAVMNICNALIKVIPIAIWAFITLFMKDLNEGLEVSSLAWYLTCVIAANLIQAFIVLPLILKWRGVSFTKLAKAMFPALSVAFFTKSSSAALPMAMRCAEERAFISNKVSSFSLPLCTTINMNACCAFIFTTVLFVSMSHGMVFTLPEMGIWILIATIAAIGNAGVPMGCYFLSSALLAAMNVPLHILGVILPFYGLIDMLESSINVWSDACVTACVDKDVQAAVPDKALRQTSP